MFCLFLGVWLPSLPCSGVAWSRHSSALFIVYLPNEGGGTLRRVIDSSPSSVGFLAETCSEGEGGQDQGVFFLHASQCFCANFFFSSSSLLREDCGSCG